MLHPNREGYLVSSQLQGWGILAFGTQRSEMLNVPQRAREPHRDEPSCSKCPWCTPYTLWMKRGGFRELRCVLRFWNFYSLDTVLRSVCMCKASVVINVGWRIQPPLPSHLSMIDLWLPQFCPVECNQKSWSKTPGKTFSKGQAKLETPVPPLPCS